MKLNKLLSVCIRVSPPFPSNGPLSKFANTCNSVAEKSYEMYVRPSMVRHVRLYCLSMLVQFDQRFLESIGAH